MWNLLQSNGRRWGKLMPVQQSRQFWRQNLMPFSMFCLPGTNGYLNHARSRGLIDFPHMSPTLGLPEDLDFLSNEVPEGWYVMGYPWQTIDTPEHRRF